jgi:putative IMPACT (imprinted ancient) family translation regulator
MLVREGISDIAVMITRYFGGIKLGTGGLVRAYTSTAKLAVAAAGLSEVAERLVIVVESDYSAYNRIAGEGGALFSLGPVVYTDKVRMEMLLQPEDRERVRTALQTSAPGAKIISEEMRVVRTPVR